MLLLERQLQKYYWYSQISKIARKMSKTFYARKSVQTTYFSKRLQHKNVTETDRLLELVFFFV
jgi:hypothetical protein